MKKLLLCFVLVALIGCSGQSKELVEGNSKEIAQGFIEAFYDLDLEAYEQLVSLEMKIQNDAMSELNSNVNEGDIYNLSNKIKAIYCDTGFCKINEYCSEKLQKELNENRILYLFANNYSTNHVTLTFNTFEFERHEDLTEMIYDVKVNVTYLYDEVEFTEDALLTLTLEQESEGMYKVSNYEVIQDLRFRDL